ncbi:hypothetical protein BDQ12DRAFT_668280 [Crucibulum laeve]|uniref:G domain-containing protein n=1 Tax=Crucibulum laeve TaxID=68775 RepID=A0A5C3M492_9AGAR|nr:hypothetical protein BDQ12DRAFT_668280 [Crucibulum laeve]
MNKNPWDDRVYVPTENTRQNVQRGVGNDDQAHGHPARDHDLEYTEDNTRLSHTPPSTTSRPPAYSNARYPEAGTVVSAPPPSHPTTNSRQIAHAPTTSSTTQPTSIIQVPTGGNTARSVVIFGETGTGKSSLINMLAGESLAGVSNQAMGYTFGSSGYLVTIDSERYHLWDTAGLNEGDHGKVRGDTALRNLQELIYNLRHGVSLLVYCIRGSRFRDILKVNYDLFSNIICQSKVPIVIVVTGLENEDPMEGWWEQNAREFDEREIYFAGHACVTTSKGKKTKSGAYMFEDEYELSTTETRELIKKAALEVPWKIDGAEWMEKISEQVEAYYEKYNRRAEVKTTTAAQMKNGARGYPSGGSSRRAGDRRSEESSVSNSEHASGESISVAVTLFNLFRGIFTMGRWSRSQSSVTHR